MSDPHQTQQSHLFTVRIWLDASGQMRLEWRGKVHHVQSGAWRHFRDWETLVGFLQRQIAEEKEELRDS